MKTDFQSTPNIKWRIENAKSEVNMPNQCKQIAKICVQRTLVQVHWLSWRPTSSVYETHKPTNSMQILLKLNAIKFERTKELFPARKKQLLFHSQQKSIPFHLLHIHIKHTRSVCIGFVSLKAITVVDNRIKLTDTIALRVNHMNMAPSYNVIHMKSQKKKICQTKQDVKCQKLNYWKSNEKHFVWKSWAHAASCVQGNLNLCNGYTILLTLNTIFTLGRFCG